MVWAVVIALLHFTYEILFYKPLNLKGIFSKNLRVFSILNIQTLY